MPKRFRKRFHFRKDILLQSSFRRTCLNYCYWVCKQAENIIVPECFCKVSEQPSNLTVHGSVVILVSALSTTTLTPSHFFTLTFREDILSKP